MKTAEVHLPESAVATQVDRRAVLIGAGAAAAGLAAVPFLRRAWYDSAAVFVARNQRYDGPIEQTIRDGLRSGRYSRPPGAA